MLESQIERKLVNGIKKLGGLSFKFVSPGTLGVPDRIVITPAGKVIFVELKSETGRLSKLQKHTIEQIRKRGADVRVVKGQEEVNQLLIEIGGSL